MVRLNNYNILLRALDTKSKIWRFRYGSCCSVSRAALEILCTYAPQLKHTQQEESGVISMCKTSIQIELSVS